MQALLITAYKDTDQLIGLLRNTHKDFKVFVHVDKKSDIDLQRIEECRFDNVSLINSYTIPWGGFNHLKAVLELLKMAVADDRVAYIHIISAQDTLVRNYQEFQTKFDSSSAIYMTVTPITDCAPKVKQRLERWVCSANMDSRRKTVKICNLITYGVQILLGKKRNRLGEYQDIYKGMLWTSMPVAAAEYVLRCINEKRGYMQALKHTVIPEEFFFQTIFMNSIWKENVVTDNLRYTDWTYRNGSVPAILDESDLEAIKQSNAFFARKIDLHKSEKLLQELQNERSANTIDQNSF